MLLDVSIAMLRRARTELREDSTAPPPSFLVGDALRMPFHRAAFQQVVALGNAVGFAEGRWDAMLRSCAGALAPSGTLLVEIAPGHGERARYLHRLPTGAVRRLLRAPRVLAQRRVEGEGFTSQLPKAGHRSRFRRLSVAELDRLLDAEGLRREEAVAVAPCLGTDAERIKAVAEDPVAWVHLLELEEAVGRSPERWASAAAVLLSYRRAP